MTDASPPAFTVREFRDALGGFATGVAIVSAEVDGVLLGSTVSSFNSVSLSPPLILFSIARSAQSFALWERATLFGVTILGHHQVELSNRFAKGGSDKWAGIVPLRGMHGVPLLRAGLATFECETHGRHDGGDHVVVVGRVLSFTRSDGEPLLFHGGRYRRLQQADPVETPPSQDGWLHGW